MPLDCAKYFYTCPVGPGLDARGSFVHQYVMQVSTQGQDLDPIAQFIWCKSLIEPRPHIRSSSRDRS
jgi:hypothetical protein